MKVAPTKHNDDGNDSNDHGDGSTATEHRCGVKAALTKDGAVEEGSDKEGEGDEDGATEFFLRLAEPSHHPRCR